MARRTIIAEERSRERLYKRKEGSNYRTAKSTTQESKYKVEGFKLIDYTSHNISFTTLTIIVIDDSEYVPFESLNTRRYYSGEIDAPVIRVILSLTSIKVLSRRSKLKNT